MGALAQVLSALGIHDDAAELVVNQAMPITALVVVLALTILAYFRMRSTQTDPLPEEVESKKKFSGMAPAPANDAWEERRRRGIAAASTSKKENASEAKPFGSSYYYAHNSTNAKGGYADGLRMEDFTMNGPRLLSKNGVPGAEEVQEAKDILEEPIPQTSTAPKTTTTPPRKRSTPITKYLWDDPGDASGIATIRIETLPGATSTEFISWKDAKIRNVSATLEGEGLLVIATNEDEKDYRLHIPKLYDRVTEVRTVVKAKRLLIKIHKRRNGINFGGKSNLEPWPQPQKPSYKL